MISACSFVFNEANCIRKCLESIRPWVEEIVIYDLESTDGTMEIAKEFTTEVFKVPYVLCGDGYKMSLRNRARGSWLLWIYPDEIYSEAMMKVLDKLTQQDKWSSFAFMRREYLDGVKLQFDKGGEKMAPGSDKIPNYQNRFHKKCDEIFYSELVHAEIHGKYNVCPMPPEYYIEHRKSSVDQEWDNRRLYIYYKYLVWKWGNTKIEPYRKYLDSYRDIIAKSEIKNLSGERKIHLSEEFWWDWDKYVDTVRISLDEFKELVGMSYEEFLKYGKEGRNRSIIISKNLIDEKMRVLDSECKRI